MAGKNMLDGAQVIVDYLIREKVPYAFGLCGHGNIQFIDALYGRSNEIKTISVHHETVAGFMADVYYRVSGQPTATFTSCGPGSANMPIALGNSFLELGAVPRGHRKRADEPVQPWRLPGALSPLPGGLPLDRACLLQARVPADPRRDGAACGAPGVEDDGDRKARPGGARRALRRVPRSRRRGDARSEGVDRQHLLPLRRRPRGRREGGRSAARCRTAGDPHRPGRQVWRRRCRSAGARREALDSGRVVGERHRRDRRLASAGAWPRRPQRRLSREPRDAPGRRAARARRAVRRPHLELVAARLLVHHPADQAHPCRHRSRRDRPQLSRRARPDGRRAHLPAPGARCARRPQGCRRTRRGAQEVARHHRRLSQRVGGVRRAGLHRRCLADQSAARRVRDRQVAAS